MMAASTLKSEPDLKDLLDMYRKDIFLSFNCHAIAKVNRFNAEKQTCEATINYQRSYLQTNTDGTTTPYLVAYPLLVDVPVLILGGTNSHLSFPSASIEGVDALIMFNDRDLDNWYDGSNGMGVKSNRLHSFADGIALIGLRSLQNSIDDYDPLRALLRNGAAGVGVSTTKIKVYNATTTLNTQLQALTTQLQALTTQLALLTVTTGGVPSGVPNNAVAITAIGTSIGNIATQIGGLLE